MAEETPCDSRCPSCSSRRRALTKTVHEYCQQNLARYRDYDQCYSECTATRNCTNRFGKALAAGLQSAGQGMQQGAAQRTAPAPSFVPVPQPQVGTPSYAAPPQQPNVAPQLYTPPMPQTCITTVNGQTLFTTCN